MASPENNIRRWRTQRGLTLEQLAAKTRSRPGSPPPDLTTIHKLETGKRRLTTEWMERIAEALEVDPAQLLASTGDVQPVRRVPRIGRIPAGNWRQAIEDATDLIPCTKGGPNTFALEPDGDSMDLVLHEPGAVVFVDPDDREMRDGKLYAMMTIDGESTFKRFRLSPPRLEPCSSNEANRVIAIGEEPLVTIGRVIGQESDL